MNTYANISSRSLFEAQSLGQALPSRQWPGRAAAQKLAGMFLHTPMTSMHGASLQGRRLDGFYCGIFSRRLAFGISAGERIVLTDKAVERLPNFLGQNSQAENIAAKGQSVAVPPNRPKAPVLDSVLFHDSFLFHAAREKSGCDTMGFVYAPQPSG